MGGWPVTDVKRSAKAERDMFTSRASASAVQASLTRAWSKEAPGRPRIAQPGEPARLLLRQAGEVAAHGLDEQQLRQLGEYCGRAWVAVAQRLGA